MNAFQDLILSIDLIDYLIDQLIARLIDIRILELFN